MRTFRSQLEEMGHVELIPGDIQAYVEGTVGWTAERAVFRFAGGREVAVRTTTVLHQEDGEWKMVQSHASAGVPNEELVGKALTV